MPEVHVPSFHEIAGGAHAGRLVIWEGLGPDDVGQWVSLPEFPKKTVEIVGDGTLALEGTNAVDDRTADPHGEGGALLKDDETGAVISGAGLYVVCENPLRLRPRCLAGGPFTVRMLYHR